MTSSPAFSSLITRITELKSRFLEFPDGDSFMQHNQDKLMSFRLLVHAEIEYYIERQAKHTANIFLTQWTTNNLILPGLRYLLLYSPKKFEGTNFLSISDRIVSCCNSFIDQVEMNHGIKQKNIVSLLAPIGVTAVFFDNAWLLTMDSYGSRRGSYAHKSYSVQTQIDKPTELSDLTNVLAGLKKIDQKIQKLLNPRLRKPY